MAKKIYKYPLKSPIDWVNIPVGSKILSVIEQKAVITVYVLVNTEEVAMEPYNFIAINTGKPIEFNEFESYVFLDTVVVKSEGIIHHIFYKNYGDVNLDI